MNFKPETFDIQLERYTYGGETLGRLSDGRAVFVPFGLPRERVRVRLTEERKNFARGEIIEIFETSKDRIQPRCKHFGECGGCHYQNLPYEKQLEIKTEILRDQLTRIGKIENPPVQRCRLRSTISEFATIDLHDCQSRPCDPSIETGEALQAEGEQERTRDQHHRKRKLHSGDRAPHRRPRFSKAADLRPAGRAKGGDQAGVGARSGAGKLRNSQQIPPVRHGATAAVSHWPLYSAAFGTRARSNQSLGSRP